MLTSERFRFQAKKHVAPVFDFRLANEHALNNKTATHTGSEFENITVPF